MRAAATALALALSVAICPADADGDAQRGRYIAAAGGCAGCHTAPEKGSVPYAGGRALKSPFGTFYGPNITPDPKAGIGRWTDTDFVRAMREGVRPDGAHCYPAFPYTSFTRITDSDLADLWAYLRMLPASSQASRPHEVAFPLGWRFLVGPWKWLYFDRSRVAARTPRTPAVERGAYLVEVLGHCGECHSPRNLLGATKRDRAFAGGHLGGKGVPNLTPTRLKKWSDDELKEFLQTGITPDFDSASEAMAEVVRNTTSQLTAEDLAAMVAYLRALPPLPEEPK